MDKRVYVPAPPDYTDASMWRTALNDSTGTGADVRYTKPVVAAPNTMCINPVNWRTDGTQAALDDSITVTLDERAKVLSLHRDAQELRRWGI